MIRLAVFLLLAVALAMALRSCVAVLDTPPEFTGQKAYLNKR